MASVLMRKHENIHQLTVNNLLCNSNCLRHLQEKRRYVLSQDYCRFIIQFGCVYAKYCNEYVCVCLSVREDIFGVRNHTRDLYQIVVHVAYGRGSVFLQQ